MNLTVVLFLISLALPNIYTFTPTSIRIKQPTLFTKSTRCNHPYTPKYSDHKSTPLFMGYKFGDISRSIGKKLTNAINEKTGRDKYEFGDLSRWLDKKAKENAANITGKEEYEFGDLSKWVDARVKDKVNEMSGNSEYEFGDLTKEILSRVFSGDYEFKDLLTLCKILMTFGVGLSPVASFFPVKFLIDFLNFSILEDVGAKVVGGLAQELDRRVKKAITGDEKYQLGDLTKREILKYTNKDAYSFGDITKTILADVENGSVKEGSSAPKSFLSDSSMLTQEMLNELDQWDKALAIDVPSSEEIKK